eukprot:gene8684-11735_t
MISFVVFVLILIVCLFIITDSYEQIDLSRLKREEIAIVQYDSRKIKDYWQVSAQWNNKYCQKHGHIFIYYSSRPKESCRHKDELLASPWCKVKAMIAATKDYPNVKLFFYMDSDAVIDEKFATLPLNSLARMMQTKLSWDPIMKPIVFNQDGPCWWCSLVLEVGYTMCLNAGTVAWYRHEISEMILQQWWDASMDPYEGNPIKRKFRLKWPWEQDRQMAVYNQSSQFIQIASQPERTQMQMRAGVNDWCLSHLPGSGCFISHYCANSYSKQNLKKIYGASEVIKSSLSKSLDDDRIKSTNQSVKNK